MHHAEADVLFRLKCQRVNIIPPNGWLLDGINRLSFHKISETKPGFVAPGRAINEATLVFGREARDRIMLIHCWAGIRVLCAST